MGEFVGLDVGNIIASVMPLGDGGSTRARFQLVALANRLWRRTAVATPSASARLWDDILDHMFRAWTLYWSVFISRYVPILLRSYTLVRLLQFVYRFLRHQRRAAKCAELIFAALLVSIL